MVAACRGVGIDLIEDFAKAAPLRDVELELIGFEGRKEGNIPDLPDVLTKKKARAGA